MAFDRHRFGHDGAVGVADAGRERGRGLLQGEQTVDVAEHHGRPLGRRRPGSSARSAAPGRCRSATCRRRPGTRRRCCPSSAPFAAAQLCPPPLGAVVAAGRQRQGGGRAEQERATGDDAHGARVPAALANSPAAAQVDFPRILVAISATELRENAHRRVVDRPRPARNRHRIGGAARARVASAGAAAACLRPQRRAGRGPRRRLLPARSTAGPPRRPLAQGRVQPAGPVRVLHRPGGRPGPGGLRDTGPPRGRPRRDDHRGAGGRGALGGGVRRHRRQPVRVLHAGDHRAAGGRVGPGSADARSRGPGAPRPPLSLHRVADHPGGGAGPGAGRRPR